MLPLFNRNRFFSAAGVVLLAGILLRLWNYAGGRSLWLDETMVAIDIIHLTPAGLMGALPFDQVAPIGWLLLEKACLHLGNNFEYTLRLPSLIGGIVSLFVYRQFLKSCVETWEMVAGVAMLSLFPVFIEYSAEVKPYILDLLFSAAILHASVLLIRTKSGHLSLTLTYGAIGLLCIPLSFGGTFAMAGTGTLLFVAAIIRKERAWALGLVGVGLLWGVLFLALYRLSYAHNAGTITNMTDLYWTESFAPLPTSLDRLFWYARTAAITIGYLLSSANAQLAAILWLYGMVRIGAREPWLAALLISTIVATLMASMLSVYPFSTRLVLGLAPALITGVASGAVGVAMQFRHRALAATALIALLGLSPAKQTATAAIHSPPFPNEEIKPNLAYLQDHYRAGDTLFLHPRTEAPFFLYASRFGLAAVPYRVTTNFRLDPSCIYDDVRVIRDKPRAWLLFSHLIKKDETSLKSLMWHLGQVGTLKLVREQPGSSLYLYTADEPPDASVFPTSAAICATPRPGKDFLERISDSARRARRNGEASALDSR